MSKNEIEQADNILVMTGFLLLMVILFMAIAAPVVYVMSTASDRAFVDCWSSGGGSSCQR